MSIALRLMWKTTCTIQLTFILCWLQKYYTYTLLYPPYHGSHKAHNIGFALYGTFKKPQIYTQKIRQRGTAYDRKSIYPSFMALTMLTVVHSSESRQTVHCHCDTHRGSFMMLPVFSRRLAKAVGSYRCENHHWVTRRSWAWILQPA